MRATTSKRQINAVRNYWEYLIPQDERRAGRGVFAALIWPAKLRKTADPTVPDFSTNSETRVPRFTPAEVVKLEVVKLWKTARGDPRDMVTICAHTGACREGVLHLHVETVRSDDPVPYLDQRKAIPRGQG